MSYTYDNNYHFETIQLHAGQENPDPATDARAVPIYQTTSFVFKNSAHAAARFALADAGNIYGRLTNSTVDAFQKLRQAYRSSVLQHDQTDYQSQKDNHGFPAAFQNLQICR